MPWLRESNVHPKDALITFIADGHKYLYVPTGERIRKSTTGVLKPFFDTFDGMKICKSYFASWLRNESHKYHHLALYLEAVCATREQAHEQMCAHWMGIGDAAAAAGTAMHEQLELFIQNELPDPKPGEAPPKAVLAYLGFLDWFYPDCELKPWRCEFQVVYVQDGVPVVAGTIDFIMKDNLDRFWLFDWKRVSPKKKGLLGKRSAAKSMFTPTKASGPFAEFDADSYSQYSAQLLGYRWIIEHGGYDMEIAGCFLVQIHDDLDKAHVVAVDDAMEEAVNTAMLAEVAAAKAEAAAAAAATTGPIAAE